MQSHKQSLKQSHKQWPIFLISLVFTVSFSWFSLASNRETTTAPSFKTIGNQHHSITTKSP
jgi:hypothetical protein